MTVGLQGAVLGHRSAAGYITDLEFRISVGKRISGQ